MTADRFLARQNRMKAAQQLPVRLGLIPRTSSRPQGLQHFGRHSCIGRRDRSASFIEIGDGEYKEHFVSILFAAP